MNYRSAQRHSNALWVLTGLLSLLVTKITSNLILGSISATVVLVILCMHHRVKEETAWLFKMAELCDLLPAVRERDDGEHEVAMNMYVRIEYGIRKLQQAEQTMS